MVRRNPQGALGGLNPGADFGHGKIALAELQQALPNVAPTVPGNFAQSWMMHPAGEQGLAQIGNLPVPSFSSSHGSLDGSEYGSGAASNADLSVSEMLIAPDQGFTELGYPKQELRRQIEYYFSAENLIKDRYLASKMDNQRFVSVALVAGFPRVRSKTLDLGLVTEIMRSSDKMEMDESGANVRARAVRTSILFDTPDNYSQDNIQALLKIGDSKPLNIEMTDKNCWCIDYEDELQAYGAMMFLNSQAINGIPINARMKSAVIGGPVNAFRPMDNGFHVPGVQDESVQMNRPGDLTPAHPYAPFSAYPGPGAQFFPAVPGPVFLWQQPVPGMNPYMELYNYAAMNGIAVPQFQQPAVPPYRGAMPQGRGGRGARRGGGSGTYSNNMNRGGRGRGTGSIPTSGRNSAMSETRSEHGYNVAHGRPDQNSRHGSFSSVNGVQDILSPTSTRSSSNTPPGYHDHREGYAEDKRNNFPVPRKPSRPYEAPGNEDLNHAAVPVPAKEPLPNFDLESTMFPPLPGQLPQESVNNVPAASPPVPLLNISAADVVRGVASPKVHSPSKSVHEGESYLDVHDPNHKIAGGNNRAQNNAHFSNPVKKEQGSSTDDLPRSGRDAIDVKARSEVSAEKAKISSSGTQTPSSSTGTQSNFTSTSDARISPNKSTPKKENQENLGNLSSPEESRTEGFAHSPRSGGGSRASDEGSVAGMSNDSKSLSGENGKNDTFSYARIAQMNRDKLLVAGAASGTSSTASRPTLTKQVSADSSSQSQEERRSSGYAEPSSGSRSGGPSRSTHREQRTQTRSSDLMNGHVDDHRHERLSNGVDQAEVEHQEDEDNEGFTAVIKHKTPRHENRARGSSFRNAGGPQN